MFKMLLIWVVFFGVEKSRGGLASLKIAHHILDTSSLNFAINFSGEKVPLTIPFVISRYEYQKHFFERNAIFWKALKGRSFQYFPIASAILKHYSVPDDFKFLLFTESFLTNAVSEKGAIGYWQIMKNTAQDFGLSTRIGQDDRQNFIKSTNMACWYLRKLYLDLGSWTLAAAAYNEGAGRLKRNMNKQNSRDYYQLILNSETSNYIFKILAIKYLYIFMIANQSGTRITLY